MDKAEFNLSVLENAVDFSSPFRSCANYENIVGLIKEEIDINADDETEPSKVTKRATHVARVSECGDSNGVFKSPHKRNSFPRARTPAARQRRTHEFQRNERTTDRAETPRARSLGAVKPGRSGQWRRNHSSTSRSSDGADTSVSEATEPALERTAESGKQNGAESNRAETKFNGAGEVQSTTGLSEKPDRLSGVSSCPGVTQSDDFVESSQSRTSSTLRTKLISNGGCGGRLNGEDASDGYAESDEDCQNFSLKFSPAAKSLASNPDSSVTPPRLGKRRGSATSSAEGPASKLRKVSASTNAKMPGCEISAVPSPFKVLTQEMENCITSSDYEQMSENLQSDTANSASFTFETIELLNEYEDSNEQVNNRILSKIFSSPSSTKVKEEPADSSEPVVPCDQRLVEDPLRIVENVRASGPPRETKRASCSKFRKAKDAKTTVRKKSANVVRRSSSKSSSQVTSETSENVASGGAARRKSKTKKSTLPKERARSKSLEIKTELDENVATSEAREPTEKRTENEVDEKLEEDKARRHSARFAVKTPAKMALSELEDDVDLAVKAVNVSKRIEEVAKKMVTGKRTLTVLTQEMKNCITSSDYEQMSENLQSDTANSASFTFETIELLNEYEDSNEQVNNRILSKIFSSPSSTKVKEEPADSSEPVVPCDQRLVEDPLRIVENVRASGPPRETKRASCSKFRKAKDAKTTVRKKSANVVRRSSSKSSSQVTSETSENVASGGAARRKSKTKKSTLPKERARSKSLEIKTELDENVATSEAREPTEKRTENEVGEKLEEDKARRHSARLAVKTPAKMALSELEDDVDLAVEAVNVSKRIEEVAKKMVTGKRTLTKLKDMVIRLRHEVLPQHTIESRAGSKALTYSQQKQFLRFAPLSKETYSPAEDEIIRSNWHAFCQDHDWNPEDYKPFLRLKHGDRLIMRSLAKRRLFVQFLANGLPNRPLCSVYSRFKTLYGERSSAGARYTSEEDMQILAYMLHKPAENPDHKCSELAKVLDRTRESISKRYKKLMKKYCEDNENKVLTKVEWNLPLAGKFISTLLDVSLSKNTMELKDAFIPKVVWLKMEEKMKIDHLLLKRFWEQQLHLQLFAEKPLYLNRIKIMLIEHMYAKQIWHPTEIKWRHIVRNFDGLTISFLRKIFNHLTMKTSTKIRTRNFKRILDWLYTKKIEELMSGPRDKCLPRIFYMDKMARFRIEDVGTLRSGSECSDTNELHV